MLEGCGLNKSYGTLKAAEGISLSLVPGQILGLLGPNGAGKTTTVSMLAGLMAPDSGEVLVDGRPMKGDSDPAKAMIGLVPQELALVDELSAGDNLAFFGALYGMRGKKLREAVEKALGFVGLEERSKDRVSSFSGGMKRRLNLAASLLHDPPVLLLDEPTVGVDPQSRNAIFDNLGALKEQGKAMLYTTHYMEEAERLCDRIQIMDHGKTIAEGTLRDLSALLPATSRLLLELKERGGREWLPELLKLPGVQSASEEEGTLSVTLRDLPTGAPEVLAWLSSKGVAYTHMSSERAGLEEVFLALTGKGLRDS